MSMFDGLESSGSAANRVASSPSASVNVSTASTGATGPAAKLVHAIATMVTRLTAEVSVWPIRKSRGMVWLQNICTAAAGQAD